MVEMWIPVITQAGQWAGINPERLRSIFPSELTLWIGPAGETSPAATKFIRRISSRISYRCGCEEISLYRAKTIIKINRRIIRRADRAMRMFGYISTDPYKLSRKVAINMEHRSMRDLQVQFRRGTQEQTIASIILAMVAHTWIIRSTRCNRRCCMPSCTDTSLFSCDLSLWRRCKCIYEAWLLGGYRTCCSLLYARRHLLSVVLRHYQISLQIVEAVVQTQPRRETPRQV